MKILKWLKGIKKKREVMKREPNKDFEFDELNYDMEILNGFNFLYCNDYTENLYKTNFNIRKNLALMTCKITVSQTTKSLLDLLFIISLNFINKKTNLTYDNIYIEYKEKNVILYLRGDIDFYSNLCETHNNIITRFIRNNIFPNGEIIETPNEFLNNIFNSINYPNKILDILFIENNLNNPFKPVVGLSFSKAYDSDLDKYFPEIESNIYMHNNRYILYIQYDKIPEELLNYIILNVNHGEKLFNLLHQDIEDDIDEYIN